MNSEHIISQLFLRAWPFPYGAGRIIDKLFSGLRFRSSEAVIRTTDGFNIKVMPNDWIGRHLYLMGEFDRSTAAALIKFARRGDTLIDVGANIGYVSACFLAKVPQSRAVCIEPVPLTFALLEENMEQFSGRAALHKIALSSAERDLFMEVDNTRLGMSCITQEQTGRTIPVKTKCASDFFSSIEKADIIKIDVEGHELEVLHGLSEHLDRLRPRAIYFEHFGNEADGGVIPKLLSGYTIFGIKKYLTHLRLLPPNGAFNDYIALRDLTNERRYC